MYQEQPPRQDRQDWHASGHQHPWPANSTPNPPPPVAYEHGQGSFNHSHQQTYQPAGNWAQEQPLHPPAPHHYPQYDQETYYAPPIEPQYYPPQPQLPPHPTYARAHPPPPPLPYSHHDPTYLPSAASVPPYQLEDNYQQGYRDLSLTPEQLAWDLQLGVDDVYEGQAPFLYERSPVENYYPPTYPLNNWVPHEPPSSSTFLSGLSRPPNPSAPPSSAASAWQSHDSPQTSSTSSRPNTAQTVPSQCSPYPPTPQQHAASAPPTPAAASPSILFRPSNPVRPQLPRYYSQDSNPAVALAASNRALHHNTVSPLISATTSIPHARNRATSGPSTATKPKTAAGKYHVVRGGGSKKPMMEISSMCWTCADPIARLVLRGQDVETMVPKLSCSCVNCLPVPDDPTKPEDDDKGKKKTSSDSATYRDTLSAAVDLMQGLKVDDEEIVGRPVDGPQVELPAFLKKEALQCDVCSRIVGAGSVSATTQNGPAQFMLEVICNRCDELYAPCSDCGGGGGRLTPGRWRCKELFPNNRRTCQLSHARNPTLDEVSYEVFNIDEISPAALPSLEARCRQLFFNARLGVLARPEFLSQGDGLCTTFAQAEKTTVDAWNLVSPTMKVNVEATREIRRYVGLQYSTPHRRRSKPTPEMVAAHKKLEKVASGFFLIEYDLKHGAVFFAIVAPWATTGQAFDAHSLLGEVCIARMKADLIEINNKRASSKPPRPLYPPINCSWIVAPFKSDSRMTHSITRRGYRTLEEYLESYPDTNMDAFPPKREIFIPKQFIHAWTIYVLTISDAEDLGGPPKGLPRRRKPKA